jgi:hypothetical protein
MTMTRRRKLTFIFLTLLSCAVLVHGYVCYRDFTQQRQSYAGVTNHGGANPSETRRLAIALNRPSLTVVNITTRGNSTRHCSRN